MKRSSSLRLRILWVLIVLLVFGQTFNVFASPSLQPPNPLAALQAESAEPIAVGYNDSTGAASFLSGAIPTSGATADARGRNFLAKYGQLFGVRDAGAELSVLREDADDVGMQHIVYEQQYQGVPVFGARLVVHLDQAGRMKAVNGQFQPGITLQNLTPSLTAEAAQDSAQAALKAETIEWQQPPRLVIWTHNQGGAAARLVWEVLGFAHAPLGRWHYFIDARTGEVVYRLNELDTHDGIRQRDGRRAGESPDKASELPAAKSRTVYNANNGTSLPGTLMCSEGAPSGCNSDAVALAAFNNAGTTYDFYFNNFGRDSFNNAGATLISTVHYSSNYNNAFWSGTQMVYGDGDGVTFSPLAQDLDVVAHELTHAVTQYTSNLLYEGQSGALNESYSDVLAVFTNPTNWLLGEVSYTPGIPGDALRDLADPTKGGQWDPNNPRGSSAQPDRMAVIAVLPTWIDQGGVHINSGIPNKAAYLITNGGTFQAITTVGIGFSKAQQIYYRTQTVYNTPFTDFANAARHTYRACQDLIGQFGIVANDCNSVLNGWAAVGIGPNASQTQKVYLPLLSNIYPNPTPGIYGRVTNGGVVASGVSLSIYRCPTSGGSCTVSTTGATDSGGVYHLVPPTLPPNFVYIVVYLQPPGTDCTLWDEWDGNWITQFSAGDTKFGGDFDIRDFQRISPSGGVAGTSKTFVWNARTLPAGMLQDLPELVVYNSTGSTVLYNSGALARGTTSRGPISGFTVGQTYLWNVNAYGPYGLGIPLCARQFTITSSAAGDNIVSTGVEVVLPGRTRHGYPETLTLPRR